MRGFCATIVLCLLVLSPNLYADELDQGRQMLASGDKLGAAEFFNNFAKSHPNDGKITPEALALCGRALDLSADDLTGKAEKACYWGSKAGVACMNKFAAQYNARFGEDSFRYEHGVTYIFYTGSHYKKILEQFPKSAYTEESSFYLLLHSLIGHPDTVLPKIKEYIAKHSKGEWNRRGRLLWARVNEDIWFVHKQWSWVLYNYELSEDDLIIKAEPYRQEALRTYESLMKDKKTAEGEAAKRDYDLLKNNKFDGFTYSIVNDSSPGTLAQWGIK